MTCKLCNIRENKELLSTIKLYEDDRVIAVLSKKPTSMCHVIIFPKNHYTIMEQAPDDEIGHAFSIANKISQAMFESLNIQGTNIFVQNGVAAGQEEPHFSIHIIARIENDGVKLQWELTKASEDELSTIELKYKEHTRDVVFSKEGEISTGAEPAESESEEINDEDGENYMLRYFNRIP